MTGPALTPTSYLVLGLVSYLGACTPYDMKRMVASSIGHFWSFPHSQLYAEPTRLAALGLLDEEQEQTGRRRRTYRITPTGLEALQAWLREPDDSVTEIRDVGLLKLFFGREAGPEAVRRLAGDKAAAHRKQLAAYEQIAALDIEPHQRATLEVGLRWEHHALEFWTQVAQGRLTAIGDPGP